MRQKNILCLVPVAALLIAPSAMADRNDLPPPGSKPLSEIIKTIEGQGLGAISEAGFDDGLWEVKVCEAGACQKLYLDPATGAEQRRKKTDSDRVPPENAMPLSSILQSAEARDQGIVTEAEIERRGWEVELRKDRKKTKLRIDPVTGEIKAK